MASSSDYVDDIEKYIIKEVPNFPMYYATECGRVISKHRGRLKFINGKFDKNGYVHIILRKDGVSYYRRLHRVVAETFLLCEDKSYVVAHIDGDVYNNSKSNLKYCTQKENIADKELHGTKHIGENVHNATITEEIAKRVKIYLSQNLHTSSTIARILNISKYVVDNIKYNNTWVHVNGEINERQSRIN